MAEKSFISLLVKWDNGVPYIASCWHSLTFNYFFRANFNSLGRLQNLKLWNDDGVVIIKINILDEPMNWYNTILNTHFDALSIPDSGVPCLYLNARWARRPLTFVWNCETKVQHKMNLWHKNIFAEWYFITEICHCKLSPTQLSKNVSNSDVLPRAPFSFISSQKSKWFVSIWRIWFFIYSRVNLYPSEGPSW